MSTFDTPEPISAIVELVAGHVRIIAGDRAGTVVERRPNDPSNPSDVKAAEQTRVEFSGGTLSVKGPLAESSDMSNEVGSIQVTIQLPAGSRVQASTRLGDVHGSGRLGACRVESRTGHIHLEHTGELDLNTAFGNVVLGRVDGRAWITTGFGKVQISELGGTTVVKNSNGDTTIGTATGPVRIEAANGDIVAERASNDVAAKTAFGSVTVHEAIHGSVVLETGMGNIDIGIRAGTTASLELKTQLGQVHNTIDAETPETASDHVEVRAHTPFGEITVRRSEPF